MTDGEVIAKSERTSARCARYFFQPFVVPKRSSSARPQMQVRTHQNEQGVDWHLGLDLRRLARSVLPCGSGEKELALLLQPSLPDHRDQRLVLSNAVPGGREGVARPDPG